jgi:hypothetical protein
MTADTFGTSVSAPGHPFGTPWLMFVDCCRVMCMLCCGAGIVGGLVRWRAVDGAKRALIAACAVYSLSTGETEWDRLGYWVGDGGRLWLNLAASVLFAYWTARRIAARFPAVTDGS